MSGQICRMLLVFAVCACGASSAQAAVIVATDAGTTHNVQGALTGFATNGAQMDGMLVSVTFAAGGNESRDWEDTGATSGGVIGTGWSLAVTGDTFGATWTLTSTILDGITRLVINGIPGGTLFDTGFGLSTPGSENGNAFISVIGHSGYDITATFRNAVSLNNNFYGDLYGVLDIQFDRGFNGPLSWTTDTDSATADSVITPSVPEPSSIALLVLGAAGMVAQAVRGRRKQLK